MSEQNWMQKISNSQNDKEHHPQQTGNIHILCSLDSKTFLTAPKRFKVGGPCQR